MTTTIFFHDPESVEMIREENGTFTIKVIAEIPGDEERAFFGLVKKINPPKRVKYIFRAARPVEREEL